MATSDLETALAAIDAAIAAYATHGVASYTVDGQTVTRRSLTDLLADRAALVAALSNVDTYEEETFLL